MEKSRIAFVTGCSSGIGRALIDLLPAEGYVVVGTALPQSYEALLAEPSIDLSRTRLYPLDVADYAAASEVLRTVARDVGPIDVLVNNAGISYRSTVEDMSPEDEQRQIQVNYLGPMHLIRECLPSMRARQSGRIVNVSSVGGMMAMPTMASYSASKFALEGASEALWYELRPWRIHVTLVRPGFINSLAFTKVQYSRRRQARQGAPGYDAHYRHMTRFVETMMRRTPCTSITVARTIRNVLRRRRPPLRVSATPDAELFHYFRRLLPRLLYHSLLYRCLPGVRQWGRSADT